jgi:O-antigen/teichoic acid export membrane protein
MLAWLLRTGSMAQSLGVYLPAILLQKALGLARVFLFVFFMEAVAEQYGLWNTAMMVFALAGPLASLGANHGLTRYASYYEVRGQLWPFYRRALAGSAILALVVAAAAMLAAGPIAQHVVASRADLEAIPAGLTYQVTVAALANALLGALYYDLVGLMIGLRVYRLVSLVELLFSVLLTALGVAVLMVRPTALALLGAHFVALAGTVAAGLGVLHVGLRQFQRTEGPEWTGRQSLGVLWQVVRFGAVAMVGNLLWLAAQYVSFHLTNRHYGKATAGVFGFFLAISQPVFMLASAAWTVVFAHAARQWEQEGADAATALLEVAYKAVAMATMALTLGVYVTAPLWQWIVPGSFRSGLPLLGGLLMFFQCLSNLALLTMLAKLRERPAIISLIALAGGAANAALAYAWMPRWGAAGAAWAAGAGMLAGGGVVALLGLWRARPRLHAGTYLVMASPVLLALPAWGGAAVWLAVLVLAVWTQQVFSKEQKKVLRGVWIRSWNQVRALWR